MIISSHIILTVAAVSPIIERSATLSNISLAFALSFLIHYFLDFIPHWDYKLLSIPDPGDKAKGEKNFVFVGTNLAIDALKTFFDCLFGVAVAFFMIGSPDGAEGILMFAIVAASSILPDVMELVYAVWKKFPFNYLHKIHSFFHTNIKLKERAVFGALLQLIMIIAAFLTIF